MGSRGAIKPREIEVILRKLSMKPLPCDHHVRSYFEFGGKLIFVTHYSFGRKDIYGRVLRNIMRDFHVDKETFFGLIDCHVDKASYIELLRRKNVL